jgi:CHAT domain-containing protein
VTPPFRWTLAITGLLASGCTAAESDDATMEGLGATPEASSDSIAIASTPFDSLFDIAQRIYYDGEYDSARVLLSALRDRAREEGNVVAEARALTWIGYAFWVPGDYGAARRVGEEALALKLAHKLEDQYYRSYNALGLLAWNENRLSESVELFEQAVAYAEHIGEHQAATARGNLALAQTELGEFAKAREGFVAMRETMAELGDPRYEANALTNLGMLEIRLGDPLVAIPLLRDAMERYASIEFARGTQSALGQLGMAYAALGDSKQAFAALDSALRVVREQGLRQEEASIYEAMAEIYRGAGDFSRALDLYARAKEINAELNLDLETGQDLRGEADIHARLGDYRRAEVLAREALAIHRNAQAPVEQLLDGLMLAETLDRLDRIEDAEAQVKASRVLAGELGARFARVEVALAEARIADRRRRSEDVLRVIRDVNADLSRGGYGAEWEARLLTSRAYERLGRIESAAVVGRRALATVERVRWNFGSGVLRTAFVADKREVYSHLVSVLLRLGEVEEAFEVADAARGHTLLQELSAAKGGADDATQALEEGEVLLREVDQLVESIDLLEEWPRAERSDEQNRELASLYQRVERARSRYELLLVQASEANPRAAAFFGSVRADADVVRHALSSGQLVVEYFVPHEGPVVMFVVSPNAVRVLEAPITAENLTSRVRLVRDLIARNDDPSELVHGVLAGLHEALIQPITGAGLVSDADELIIIPHDVLSYLPFAAVRDRTTDRYLIEDYVIRILPSTATLPVLNERRGIGAPGDASVFAPFPTELPGTRDEVRAISTVGREHRFEGKRASEAAVRDALGQERLVHVATHGVLNKLNPMFSRLDLARSEGEGSANDGRLEVHELLNLRIAAPLVFLSGCETGLGAARSTAFVPGEDYATLAQAFLYAGADDVIATLWPVEDEGAAELAKRFYEELERAGPAAALARAQRSLLSQQRYSAPYYWAAYQVAGLNGSN